MSELRSRSDARTMKTQSASLCADVSDGSFSSMDSPWDESTNTFRELEWTKISSEFTNAGYREGITAGKESALQEGFDQGFATAGVPVGRELGMIRGVVSAILSFLDETSVVVPTEIEDQIRTETQEINSRLSRIRFSDIMPPDLEAEEHARQHQEEDGNGSDIGQAGSRTSELELLEDMIEQMNTNSERDNGELLHPAKGRPKAEDLNVLKNRIDWLAARLGINVTYD